jgi:hypothetical protein
LSFEITNLDSKTLIESDSMTTGTASGDYLLMPLPTTNAIQTVHSTPTTEDLHYTKNNLPDATTPTARSQSDSRSSYKSNQYKAQTLSTVSQDDRQSEQEKKQPPESESNAMMKPSQPSFTKSLVTETGTIPMIQPDISGIHFYSSSISHYHGPSAGSSRSEEAPPAISIITSASHRHHVTLWTTMAVVLVGMFM